MRGYFYNFDRDPEGKILKELLSKTFNEADLKGADVVFVYVDLNFEGCFNFLRKTRDKFRVVLIDSLYERFPLRELSLMQRLKKWWKYRFLDKIFEERANIYFVGDDNSGIDVITERFSIDYALIYPSKFVNSLNDKVSTRKKLGIPINGVYVGYICFPTEEFGFDIFREIYSLSKGVFKVLIYPLDYKDRVYKLSEDLKGKVFISENFLDFLSAVDVMMFPYRFGCGKYLINSISLGIPVVSFKGHCADRIIKHGWNGFIAENFSIDEFAHYLVLLSSDPILRETLSKNCLSYSYGYPTIEEKASFIVQWTASAMQ
ncbi:MAG: glycosyltransferase [candidate division WOR-3 bacterium]